MTQKRKKKKRKKRSKWEQKDIKVATGKKDDTCKMEERTMIERESGCNVRARDSQNKRCGGWYFHDKLCCV